MVRSQCQVLFRKSSMMRLQDSKVYTEQIKKICRSSQPFLSKTKGDLGPKISGMKTRCADFFNDHTSSLFSPFCCSRIGYIITNGHIV